MCMMKVLVLSDSHTRMEFMRLCTEKIQPDALIHLGDHAADARKLSREFPDIPLYAVPGNCDPDSDLMPIRTETLEGVRIFMTHGHLHGVKSVMMPLLSAARLRGADVVLYGHTHTAECYREEDGLLVMNPGTCGYPRESAGLLEIRDGAVIGAEILTREDLTE